MRRNESEARRTIKFKRVYQIFETQLCRKLKLVDLIGQPLERLYEATVPVAPRHKLLTH